MFFRRRKRDERASQRPPGPPPAGAPSSSGAPRSEADASTRFLTGDASRDSASVESLLTEVANITERISRVSGERDLEELLEYIVDASVERTGAERGLLVLALPDGELEVRVARRRGGRPIEGEPRFSTSAVRRVLETGEPIQDVFNSAAEAMDLGASVYDLKLRALMAAPLSAGQERGGAVPGVLYVDSKAATREFTPGDLAFFSLLSRQIAVALEAARLHLDSLEKARLEQSLELASAVQGGLMPQVPEDVPGYDLFGWYRSAERTSGDFFDFVRVRDGRLGLVIGDVTGHGIGPALLTASAQASLRALLRVVVDPAEAVTMLNQDLAERSDDGMFLTLFLALLGSDGRVEFVNAGHTPPLVLRAADGEFRELRGTGPALGMIDDFTYERGEAVELAPGDLLAAFTDGLVEARPRRGDELFGDERLRRALARAAGEHESARDVVEAVVGEALRFSGGYLDDDVTIVLARRTA